MSDTSSTEDPLFYPIVMTPAGPLPQAPATLRDQLLNLVTFGTDPGGNPVMTPLPGYTAVLPGSLIEDISSTDVGALVLCDQARTELINSLTPVGANSFLIRQLGQLFGFPSGTLQNVTVGVVFHGPVGFMIQAGFLVSDGAHTFVVQEPGIIGGAGASETLATVANVAGAFAVPAGSVTVIQSSVPSAITLTVTNPLQGNGGDLVETEQQYRLRVMEGWRVGCQGTADFLRSLLKAIPGVLPQRVGIQAVAGGLWKVICGGSNPDPYLIANAIYRATPSPSLLTGSATTARNTTIVITDFPDTYSVVFVTPPKQIVTVGVTWKAASTLSSAPVVSEAIQAAVVQAINEIPVGAPINLLAMEELVQDAVEPIVALTKLSDLQWIVAIDGVVTAPAAGARLVFGDGESFFEATAAGVVVTQG